MNHLSILKKTIMFSILISLFGCKQGEAKINQEDNASSSLYYHVSDSKDSMTDEITNELWIASKFNLFKVSLNIQCSKNKTTMYLDWMDWFVDNKYADRSPEGDLLLRIDDNKAFKVNIVDDPLETKIVNPVRAIKKMIGADYLKIQKGDKLIPFNIEHLEESIKDIRKNCHW